VGCKKETKGGRARVDFIHASLYAFLFLEILFCQNACSNYKGNKIQGIKSRAEIIAFMIASAAAVNLI